MGIAIEPPIWSSCHLSTKAGPNAQAMVGAITDSHHLPGDLVKDLSIVGGSLLTERISLLKNGIDLPS